MKPGSLRGKITPATAKLYQFELDAGVCAIIWRALTDQAADALDRSAALEENDSFEDRAFGRQLKKFGEDCNTVAELFEDFKDGN